LKQVKNNKKIKTETTTTELDDVKIKQGSTWVKSQKSTIPKEIYPILIAVMAVSEKFLALSTSNKIIRNLLARMFNLTPKSEKKNADNKKNKNEKTDEEKAKIREKKRKEREEKEKYNEAQNALKDENKPEVLNETNESPIIKNEKFSDEALYGPLISSGAPNKTTEQKDVNKEEEFCNMYPTNLRSEYNERVVTNIKFVVEHITLRVETVTDMISGKRVTAKVDEAPAYCSYTYNTILQLIQQHVEYFIPLNRLSIMYKDALNISRSTIYHFHYYAAQAFLPVYLELFKDLVNKAEIIQMDDTKTKILNERQEVEFEGIIASQVEEKKEETDKIKPPQNNAPEKEKIFKGLVDPRINICQTLHEDIGMLSYRKDSEELKKVNVTFITGKTDELDVNSRISIFYTHFGQAGDLLEKMLLYRKKRIAPLYIVSDLATFNQVDSATIKKHNVFTVGCNAHARRNFWNARKLDDNIYFILRCYKFLYRIEKIIANKPEVTLKYRQRYAKAAWKILIHGCKKRILPKWPKGSAPKKAVDYILKHEKELTLYMDNAKLPIDNNRSERGVRGEKLMLAGCKFRYNSEGRSVFDILRTMMTNCRSAQVNWQAYATDVLRNRTQVALNPENWTPLAWKKRNKI